MPTKEQVLEAAKQPTVEGALKQLFPEHFKEEEIEPFEVNYSLVDENGCKLIVIAKQLAPRGLEFKSFYCNSDYQWKLINHNGYQILIPTPKG